MLHKIPLPACLFLFLLMIGSCAKDEPETPPANGEKMITSFVIKRADGTLFDPGDYAVFIRQDTIFGSVPPATDLTNLVAEIRYEGARITPGMGPQDFSRPIKYTVIAQDSSKRQYTVIVTSRKMIYIGGSQHFYALDEGTGKQVWQLPGAGDLSYSDPALHNGVVYVGSTNGNVYALAAATGVVIWQHALPDATECGPAVSGNTVYIGSNDNYFSMRSMPLRDS